MRYTCFPFSLLADLAADISIWINSDMTCHCLKQPVMSFRDDVRGTSGVSQLVFRRRQVGTPKTSEDLTGPQFALS